MGGEESMVLRFAVIQVSLYDSSVSLALCSIGIDFVSSPCPKMANCQHTILVMYEYMLSLTLRAV
jgi:hypothetical protein